jgi:hypothetical protein
MLIISLAFAMSSIAHAQTTTFDANAAAQQLSDAVSEKLGSPDGIRQNAVNPLTATGTTMTSITGTTPFNVSPLSCPSSSKFLQITITPDTGTGEIGTVLVQQDTNFDGTLDYAYSAPASLSGLCGNGAISCDPGTWNNCKYLKWTTNGSGGALLQSANTSDLGGCFCINNSCGSNLVMNQLNYVLTVLGGGASGAIQAANPGWAVSSVNAVDTTISYYGQQSANCTVASFGNSYGSNNPNGYYSNSSAMAGDAQSLVATELTDTRSVYSLVNNAAQASQRTGSYTSCIMTSGATVSTTQQWTTNPISYTFSYGIGGWDIGTPGYPGSSTVASVLLDGVVIDSSNSGNTFNYDVPPGTHTIEVTNTVLQTHGMGWCRDWGGVWLSGINNGDHISYIQTDTSWYTPNGSFYGKDWWSTGLPYYIYGCNSSWLVDVAKSFTAQLMVSVDTLIDPVNADGCASLADDSNCTLKDEIVDGVTTYSNYNPTMLSPVPSTRSIVGTNQAFPVTHDWWEKDRTYFCKSSSTSSFDLSAVTARSANIQDTTTSGGGTFYYQDVTTNGSGGYVYSSNTATLDTTGGTSSCTTACKTRVPATNTQAALSGTTAQSNVSTSSWQFYYKSCSNAVCPVAAGEEIVTSCQCINDFAESATVMETLNQAGKDLICSNGTTTP